LSKRKKRHNEEHIDESWLLPYSDLMTLLLAVFIVLFAVSQLDSNAAKSIAEQFREIMGTPSVLEGGTGIMDFEGVSNAYPAATPTPAPINYEELVALEKLKKELDLFLAKENIGSAVVTYLDERGLVITLKDSILFDSGSSEVRPDKINTLIKIGEIIKPLENYIRVEGHTDNIPINTVIYPSNWELSGARAAKVVRLFADRVNINIDKLAVVGYGDSRPVADNRTPEGRAMNRRVDIILLNIKYNPLENKHEFFE